MIDTEQYRVQVIQLAQQVHVLVRNTLMVEMRFGDTAFSRLVYVPVEREALLTDGNHIFMPPFIFYAATKQSEVNPHRITCI